MKYAHLIAALYGQPWAIEARAGRSISAQFQNWLAGKNSGVPRAYWEQEDEDEDEDAKAVASPNGYKLTGAGTAIISVSGIIGKKLGMFESACGGYDLNSLNSALSAACNDAQVQRILLDFDTPGGTVTGVLESAAAIKAAGASKPVYGWTETQCCSAGYWLASQCSKFLTSQTAIVGSIGVYTSVVDDSEAWANEGLKQNLMKAGDFKAAGMPGIPFSDKDRARMQAEVDRIYGLFTSDVIRGRGKVAVETMQGQTFLGMDCTDLNLTDGICDTRDQYLSILESYEPQRIA